MLFDISVALSDLLGGATFWLTLQPFWALTPLFSPLCMLVLRPSLPESAYLNRLRMMLTIIVSTAEMVRQVTKGK
jgi:hypothetical protein